MLLPPSAIGRPPAQGSDVQILVGPMLRHVSDTSATIFLETDGPARVTILGVEASTFEVAYHHYALVIIEELAAGSVHEYEVMVNGQLRWPIANSPLPASVIRTLGGDGPLRILFGSCRAAAPHEAPWSLSPSDEKDGKGVDSLRAHGLRMLAQSPQEWPHLLLMVGDQVYADEPSPETFERMHHRDATDGTPPGLVSGFEEYTWLYQESWRAEVERWLLSVVPTAMIFDDHDMIDDWNISASWVHEIRVQPWWQNHATGALISYWIYQHLGNLSPADLRAEGMLDRFLASTGDNYDDLYAWAMESERFTPIDGGYRFSFTRHLGRTRLVVIDCRNGRNLEPTRAMVGDEEWQWVVGECHADVDHLLLATSLPVMAPGGLHGLQVWNAALCDGRWGRPVARLSERLRRFVDLEDWPAFPASLHALLELIDELRTAPTSPATICVLSGDIHFSYLARADFASPPARSSPAPSRVYQIVSSPIRNALARRDRRIIGFALTRTGRRIGGLMTRAVRAPKPVASWTLTEGPEFANEMAMLTLEQRRAHLLVERARVGTDQGPILEAVIDVEL